MSRLGCGGAVVAMVTVVLGLGACGKESDTDTTGVTVPKGPRTGPVVPAVPRSFFGMNAQLVALAAAAGQQLDVVEKSLAEIERLGVGFVRSSFDWPALEPTAPAGGRHQYDWSRLDPWVALLATHRLRWMVTVKGNPTPTWALGKDAVESGCGSRAPPAEVADYGALISALARRYGAGGAFWKSHPGLPATPITDYEVWNEPNFANFWCPGPDPAAYARLYLAAHAAVHRVDPEARVLLGGLAAVKDSNPPENLNPRDFLGAALENQPDLRTTIDAVAVHPYAPTPPEVLASLRSLRSTLDSVGLNAVPMSVNELGWYTQGTGGNPPTSEARRAAGFAQLAPAIAGSDCDVIALSVHTWITREQNPADREDWYGLADPQTAEPYPSAVAYGDQVKALERGRARRGGPAACAGIAAR